MSLPRRLVLFLLILSSVARAQTDVASRIARVEKGLLPPVLIKGEGGWDIAERMRLYNTPGVSIAVIVNYQIDWAKAYGLKEAHQAGEVTPETIFQAGSISKSVTAMATLKLAELGEISLDQDVNGILKTWKVPESPLSAQNKVTLTRLLSHSAGTTVHGFPGYEEGQPLPTIVQILDGLPPANNPPVRVDVVPGTIFRYSGGGTVIVQCALMDREQMSFPEIMKRRVLDVLQMTRSTYSQPLPESWRGNAASGHLSDGSVVRGRYHVYPEMSAAGLWTTPTDLCKFAIEIMLSLQGKSNRVLSQETTRQMLTPELNDVALGLFLERKGSTVYFGHSGADEGFLSSMIVQKSGGKGAVVMVNGNRYDIIDEIIRSIAREYRWDDYLPVPYELARLSGREKEQAQGKYLLSADEARVITASSQGLTLSSTADEPVEILPISARTFIRRDREATYTLVHERGGHFDSLLVAFRRDVRAARRVEDSYKTPYELVEAGDREGAIRAYQSIRRDGPDSDAVSEERINRLGYRRLSARDVEGAIALFTLNVERHPSSWNVYDSLGEACAAAGDKARAIENYRKSISLNPQNTGGSEALKKLLK
ncbi:MAG TPA: serine hydrolase [Bacteroidota bacterium]|nr:serine hydrolase [Bacteroidota bacterium]